VGGLGVALSSFLDLNSGADVFGKAAVTVETTLETGATDPVSGAGGKTAPQDLAGTTVTIIGATPDEYAKLFEQSMRPFEERTGINVIYSPAGESFETLIAAGVKRGNPPDIADFPQPGYMADFARQGKLVDLRTFLSDDYLR
jgi:alpha-glucoside transport system substrate-binding protein